MINEFTIADLAMEHLGSYAEKDYQFAMALLAANEEKTQSVVPAYTTGHCKNKAQPGGCQLHNLQCGYPECDRQAQAAAEPDDCANTPYDEGPFTLAAEPVAWRHPEESYSIVTTHQKETNEFQYSDEFLAGHTEPLYTSPQPTNGAQAAMKTALDCLTFMWRDVPMNDYAQEKLDAAIAALEQELSKCQ